MLGNFSEARINFHTCKAHFVFLFFIFFCNCFIVFVIITSGWVVLFRFYAFQLLSFVLFLVFTYAFLFLRFFSFFDHPQQCCNLSRPRNVASCHFFLSIARFTPNNERIYLAVVCERFNATLIPLHSIGSEERYYFTVKTQTKFARDMLLLWTVSCQRKCQKCICGGELCLECGDCESV